MRSIDSLISRLRNLGYSAFCQRQEVTTSRPCYYWHVNVRLSYCQYWTGAFRTQKQVVIFLRHVLEEVEGK